MYTQSGHFSRFEFWLPNFCARTEPIEHPVFLGILLINSLPNLELSD